MEAYFINKKTLAAINCIIKDKDLVFRHRVQDYLMYWSKDENKISISKRSGEKLSSCGDNDIALSDTWKVF